MSGPVTEMAKVSLKAGIKPEDADSSEGKIFGEAVKTLVAQPGFKRSYYGTQVDDPSTFRLFIDWDTKDSHIAFTQSDAYKPFLGQLQPMMTAAPIIFHADLEPSHHRAAIAAPLTEVIHIYFDAATTSEEQKQVHDNVKKFREVVDTIDGHTGNASGWVLEEVEDDKTAGAKAKLYVTVIGWVSTEAYHTGRSSPSVRENLHYVSDVGKIVARQIYEVNFTSVE